MEIEFSGEIYFWRGPAPWYFVAVPEPQRSEIRAVSRMITYGWGCIPARVRIGGTVYTTSLFPKDDGYIVPVKASVRKAEGLDAGDVVTLQLTIGF
jgi:hypothetical protein